MEHRYRHSSVGIASFILGVVSAIPLLFCLVAIRMQSSPSTGITWLSIILNTLPVILCTPLLLVAFGLGLGGLFHRYRRKLFAALGLGLSLALPLLWIFLVILPK